MKRRTKKFDRNKGITLIALVITIIVLLILAGVSIATLTGSNGLITRTNQAKEETEKAGAKEKVQMEAAGSFDNYGKFNMDKLKENLKDNLGLTDEDIKDNPDGSITVTIDGYEVTVDSNGNVTVGEEATKPEEPELPEDTSGANHPELKDGMQAITFAENGTAQPVADSSKKDWYSYEETTDEDMTDGGTTDGGNSRWANATLNGNYYVWIPRYAYKIDNSVTYTSQSGTSHKIEVQFIGTNVTSSNVGTEVGEGWIVHPAFTFGGKELTGIWIGKYTTSGNTTTPTILPNENILGNINASMMFNTAQKLSTTNYDAHMMKNTEWGAVAYLAQSKYGRNGTEISRNQCADMYTGTGAGTGTNKIYNSPYAWNNATEEQKYNGEIGKLSSTTGNIYGVYDMSGGAYEYVMGVYGTQENPSAGSSGFTKFPDSKYYDLYTKTTADSSNIGDALYETKGWNTTMANADNFVNSNMIFFVRGGAIDTGGVLGGEFYFFSMDGGSSNLYGFHTVVTVK